MAYLAAILVLVAGYRVLRILRRKNVDIILRDRVTRRRVRPAGTEHIFVCVADHFEPYWKNTDAAVALRRVERWHREYPEAVAGLRDNGGKNPRHTFFYPQEEYDPHCVERLADLVRRGYGDVEVHLHHDGDSAESLRHKLMEYKTRLHDTHGLLRRDRGDIVYAFIHGNWTLDDSGADGRYCGVRGELDVLIDSGCYADFTYPSAPHPTQPPRINRVYYAPRGVAGGRAHHRGVDACFARPCPGGLLMFTGPLALRRREGRVFPAIENGDITPRNPVSADRIDSWVGTGVGVRDWPNWTFIKCYTHGTQEHNTEQLLTHDRGGLPAMYADLLHRYNDGRRYVLHFSTPWEMASCVRVLESGDRAAIASIESFSYPFGGS